MGSQVRCFWLWHPMCTVWGCLFLGLKIALPYFVWNTIATVNFAFLCKSHGLTSEDFMLLPIIPIQALLCEERLICIM